MQQWGAKICSKNTTIHICFVLSKRLFSFYWRTTKDTLHGLCKLALVHAPQLLQCYRCGTSWACTTPKVVAWCKLMWLSEDWTGSPWATIHTRKLVLLIRAWVTLIVESSFPLVTESIVAENLKNFVSGLFFPTSVFNRLIWFWSPAGWAPLWANA